MRKSRQYAQAFGRGVYADILRWGDSETLSFLCRTNRYSGDETYMDCLQRFYLSLKLNYRCENGNRGQALKGGTRDRYLSQS